MLTIDRAWNNLLLTKSDSKSPSTISDGAYKTGFIWKRMKVMIMRWIAIKNPYLADQKKFITIIIDQYCEDAIILTIWRTATSSQYFNIQPAPYITMRLLTFVVKKVFAFSPLSPISSTTPQLKVGTKINTLAWQQRTWNKICNK